LFLSLGFTPVAKHKSNQVTLYRQGEVNFIINHEPDIFETVESMRKIGVSFLTPPPDTYYEILEGRLPGHGENVERMKENAILMYGASTEDGGRLLQIFTETVIGPTFFELIQRKGDEGFGEGNFRALFKSMERDQVRRGVLSE